MFYLLFFSTARMTENDQKKMDMLFALILSIHAMSMKICFFGMFQSHVCLKKARKVAKEMNISDKDFIDSLHKKFCKSSANLAQKELHEFILTNEDKFYFLVPEETDDEYTVRVGLHNKCLLELHKWMKTPDQWITPKHCSFPLNLNLDSSGKPTKSDFAKAIQTSTPFNHAEIDDYLIEHNAEGFHDIHHDADNLSALVDSSADQIYVCTLPTTETTRGTRFIQIPIFRPNEESDLGSTMPSGGYATIKFSFSDGKTHEYSLEHKSNQPFMLAILETIIRELCRRIPQDSPMWQEEKAGNMHNAVTRCYHCSPPKPPKGGKVETRFHVTIKSNDKFRHRDSNNAA